MSGIQSSSSHLIIPKRIFAVVTLSALGGLSGVLVSNHLYNRQVARFLHGKTRAAHKANLDLANEKDAHRALFHKLTVQMDENAKDGKIAVVTGTVTDDLRVMEVLSTSNNFRRLAFGPFPFGSFSYVIFR